MLHDPMDVAVVVAFLRRQCPAVSKEGPAMLGQAEYQRVNIFQRTPLDHWQTPIAVVACPPMLNPFSKTVFLGLLITSPLYAESKPQVFTAMQLAADCRKVLASLPDGIILGEVGPAWDCIGYVRGAL